MLTRSKRDDIHSKATSQELGPGSYETNLPDFKPKNGRPGFSQSTARDTGMTPAFKTPGPGAYHLSSSIGTTISGVGSSQFLSKISRGNFIPPSDVPGPGSYSGDIVREPVVQHRPPPKKKGGMEKDITWVKVATAPSIPAGGQSFGYEEGSAGELVQCAPPVAGHSGQGSDQVGPGEYNPQVTGTKSNPKATRFAGSGKRSDVVPRELKDHPGPGSYEHQKAGTGDQFKGGVAANKTQSMFASSTTRNFLAGSSQAPGPGAYKAPSSFRSLREHLASNPKSFHAFGSSGKQPTLRDTTEEGNPGPGSYTPQLKAHAGHTRPQVASAFASRTGRFSEGPKDVNPGPGGYEAFNGTLTESLQKKVKGRYGVFGSTSSRFAPEKPLSATSSPASYNPSSDTNTAELRRKDQRQSVFRSKAIRQGPTTVKPPSKNDGLGTQYYDIKQEWIKPSARAIPRAPRFPVAATDRGDGPGPGEYPAQSCFVPGGGKSKSGSVKPMMAGSGRFNIEKPSIGPGPGAYNTTPSLLKKTFNITIGDSWE